MTEKVRIKIAAIVTALFLGAACTTGMLTHASPSDGFIREPGPTSHARAGAARCHSFPDQ